MQKALGGWKRRVCGIGDEVGRGKTESCNRTNITRSFASLTESQIIELSSALLCLQAQCATNDPFLPARGKCEAKKERCGFAGGGEYNGDFGG
jgi:hypothetical protein